MPSTDRVKLPISFRAYPETIERAKRKAATQTRTLANYIEALITEDTKDDACVAAKPKRGVTVAKTR